MVPHLNIDFLPDRDSQKLVSKNPVYHRMYLLYRILILYIKQHVRLILVLVWSIV